MLLCTYKLLVGWGRGGGGRGGYPAVHGPITTEICGIPSADTGYHSVVSLVSDLVLEGREGLGGILLAWL